MKRALLEETEALIGRYLDETIEAGELERLKELITQDPDCLDLLCSHAVIESDLWQLGDVGSVLRMNKSPGAQMAERVPRKILAHAVFAAAAALVLLAVVMALVAVREPVPFATVRASPHAVLHITQPLGEDGKEDREGELRPGSVIKVAQGVVEIRLEEGVLCHVQAPGVISLVREGLVRVDGGLARFEVEEQAHGFQVQTQGLEVTDLGTIFGVDCRVPEEPVVHVLEGSVVVRALKGRGEPETHKSRRAVALLEDGSLGLVAVEENLFPGVLPSGLPGLRFSFDEAEGTTLRATGSLATRDAVELEIGAKDSPELVPGRFGRALRFHGGRCLARSNWKGIGGTNPRTLSLWMRTRGAEGETPNGSNPTRMLGYGLFGRADQEMCDLGLRLSFEPGPKALRLVSGYRQIEGSTPLNDGEWHHLAVVMGEYSGTDWPVTTVYVDGKLEETVPGVHRSGRPAPIDSFHTVVDHPDSSPLMFGNYGVRSPSTGFLGELDEVVIVEGTLNPDQVRALYEGDLAGSGIDLGD